MKQKLSSLTAIFSTAFYPAACGGPEMGIDEAQTDSIRSGIWGGSITSPNQYPWVARLLNSSGNHGCGGTLIHPYFVLTARHCLQLLTPATASVVLGDHTMSAVEPTEQTVAISAFHFLNYDMALLQLSTPAVLGPGVALAQISRGGTLPSSGIIAGWGHDNTWPDLTSSDELRHKTVTSQVIPPTPPSSPTPHPHFLLVGSGACYGDSGDLSLYTAQEIELRFTESSPRAPPAIWAQLLDASPQ